MSSNIRVNIHFSDNKDMRTVNDLIVSEKLNTISDTYSHDHPKYGEIRYFFSCFRDSVDYDGHLLVNAFLSEKNRIGLYPFTILKNVIGDPTFRDLYKDDLKDYIEYLNTSLKNLMNINYNVFKTDNMDAVVDACTDEKGEPLL